ncbi:MAG: DUF4239 domain-containing protein [Methylobacteriaceae bacterium]|nr:DUF4239 domain-containing protein [Methylobacteriaceae bacterium]
MFLSTLPLWLSAIILVGLTTLVAMSGPALIRRRVHLDRLRVNNEVAGFKFATVGVLYAVLLAFAVIVVWEKFAEGERTAAKEAGAIATLYRLSGGLDEETAKVFRENLTDYTKAAINEEWPAMEQGRDSAHVRQALDHAYATVLGVRSSDERSRIVLSEMLRELDLVTQARRDRLIAAVGTVPSVLWLVLFGGAVLTISFTFFFGTQNVVVQTLMTGMLSLLIFAGLFVIVAIDRPFAGSVKVQPEALQKVYEEFGEGKHP